MPRCWTVAERISKKIDCISRDPTRQRGLTGGPRSPPRFLYCVPAFGLWLPASEKSSPQQVGTAMVIWISRAIVLGRLRYNQHTQAVAVDSPTVHVSAQPCATCSNNGSLRRCKRRRRDLQLLRGEIVLRTSRPESSSQQADWSSCQRRPHCSGLDCFESA